MKGVFVYANTISNVIESCDELAGLGKLAAECCWIHAHVMSYLGLVEQALANVRGFKSIAGFRNSLRRGALYSSLNSPMWLNKLHTTCAHLDGKLFSLG